MREIVAFTTSGSGSTCGLEQSTFNTAPSVSAENDYLIPLETPFILQGTATDAEGDTLSYQWDEMDAGGTAYATNATTFGSDLGGNPLFRSYAPIASPRRILPRFSTLLAGVADPAEVLPTTQRNLNFRLTVRDGESGVGEDDMQISVIDTAGPFLINEASVDETLTAGQTFLLEWEVAGTNTSPIDCTNVDIHLLAFSQDMTAYCEHVMLLNTLNDGSVTLVIQSDQGTNQGRIRVKCSDNIFFDINDQDLSISAPVQADTDCLSTDGTALPHGTLFNDAEDSISDVPPADEGDGGGGGGLFWLTVLLAGLRLGRCLNPGHRAGHLSCV
jgi:hypothetical protein